MNNYDDALSNSNKNLLTLEPWQFNPILWNHMSTSNYLFPIGNTLSPTEQSSPDKIFIDNNNIWEQVFYNKLRRTDAKIKLESFFLFEWFPRSPGLYHTEDARYARDEAQSRITKIENGVVIYDPYGKQSMLDGGIGNVRLKPINLMGIDNYFMSASSNGNCHEGFPVAIPVGLYNFIIDEIIDKGCVVKSLIGKIKNIPDRLEEFYYGNRNVPKFYLQVEDIQIPSYPKSRRIGELKITIASSFVSSYEGNPKIYATYVTFDPSKQNSFRNMVRWMEDEYVSNQYKGKILTDFDELESHFDDAPFSLKRVMNFRVEENYTYTSLNKMGIDYQSVIKYQTEVRELINRKEEETKNKKRVFISYNHKDQDIALKIKNKLEMNDIDVIMDVSSMGTGDNIQRFIEESIKTSGITISIVSKNSLLSAWVAMETIYSNFDSSIRGRKFFPINIDKEFLRREFVDEAYSIIEKEMDNINNLKIERSKRNRGTEDLDPEIYRYRRLHTDLASIISRFQNSFTVAIIGNNLESGMNKLVNDIKKQINNL